MLIHIYTDLLATLIGTVPSVVDTASTTACRGVFSSRSVAVIVRVVMHGVQVCRHTRGPGRTLPSALASVFVLLYQYIKKTWDLPAGHACLCVQSGPSDPRAQPAPPCLGPPAAQSHPDVPPSQQRPRFQVVLERLVCRLVQAWNTSSLRPHRLVAEGLMH